MTPLPEAPLDPPEEPKPRWRYDAETGEFWAVGDEVTEGEE